MRKLLFALALLLALPAQAQPVPPVEGFRIPYSAVYIATFPCNGQDFVYDVTWDSGFTTNTFRIPPPLDQPITIIGYQFMKTSGGPHSFFMIGNNYVSDDKLQLSSSEDHSRFMYPWGYGDSFPASSEAAPSVYLDLHGSCTGGGNGTGWLTYDYLLNDGGDEDVGTTYSQTLNGDTNSYQGYTAVACFPPSSTTDPSSATSRIRVTAEAAQAGAVKFNRMYVAQGGTDCSTYTFTTTAKQLTWDSLTYGHISVGAKRATDWAYGWTYDNTKSILVALEVTDGTYNRFRAKSSVSGPRSYWQAGATANSPSGTFTEGWNLLGITKIEMDGY